MHFYIFVELQNEKHEIRKVFFFFQCCLTNLLTYFSTISKSMEETFNYGGEKKDDSFLLSNNKLSSFRHQVCRAKKKGRMKILENQGLKIPSRLSKESP